MLLKQLAYAAKILRIVATKSRCLSCAWKIAHQGPRNTSDKTSIREVGSAREINAVLPEDEQVLYKRPQEVIDLVDRWLLWTWNNPNQEHVFR